MIPLALVGHEVIMASTARYTPHCPSIISYPTSASGIIVRYAATLTLFACYSSQSKEVFKGAFFLGESVNRFVISDHSDHVASKHVKETDESTLDKRFVGSSLMRHDPNDLRSQIRFQILQKKNNAPLSSKVQVEDHMTFAIYMPGTGSNLLYQP